MKFDKLIKKKKQVVVDRLLEIQIKEKPAEYASTQFI
jgi:hypothetical protein